jgi:hypothetical protein
MTRGAIGASRAVAVIRDPCERFAGVVRQARALDVLGQLFSGAGASAWMHGSSSDATGRRRDEDDRAIVEADGTTQSL